jgi:poly(A) polymerase
MPRTDTDPLLERLSAHPLAPLLRLVGEQADRLGIDVCAVGGFVRDIVLGRATPDVDFVTLGAGTGIRLAEAVAGATGGASLHVYENFGTAAIRIPWEGGTVVLEFVAARRESYRRESRKPLVEDGTREDDLLRRDFRVNAMALDLAPQRFGTLIDPHGGMQDLATGLLRTPLDPDRTFDDDPLRMVRAARFAAELGFRVDDAAIEAMTRNASRIGIVSTERVTDEVQRIVCSPTPSTGFLVLEQAGILEHVLAELTDLRGVETVDGQRHKDNFHHTLQVVDNLVDLLGGRACDETRWLRWAALLHDIGKPTTKRFVRGTGWTFHGHEELGARMAGRLFRRLRLPADERLDTVQKLIRLHHRPVSLVDDTVTDSAVRRLLFDAGDDVEDLMLLVRADITSKNPARVRRYLRAFDRVEERMVQVEQKDRLRRFQPPVDGLEIMETLGIPEGLAVGIIKNAIREAILDGEIPNEHDAAFGYMMTVKDDALRRGRLFESVVARLSPRQKRAVGAIKEAVLSPDLPADDDEAEKRLLLLAHGKGGGDS